MKWAKMRKSIYSLPSLQELTHAANHRYLEFISRIETPEIGVKLLNNLTASKVGNNHSYKKVTGQLT
jgi:hypothetical protein